MKTKTQSRRHSKLVTINDLGEFTDRVILPGVEEIVDKKVNVLREGMKKEFEDMKNGITDMATELRVGFSKVDTSMKVLSTDADIKLDKHGQRIEHLEKAIGLRGRQR